MSELSNAQNARRTGASENANPVRDNVLDLEAFTPQDLARLTTARARHQEGALNEWTEDHKRLRFARWLYEHGQIDG